MQAYKERQHACMLMLPAYMHAAATARFETGGQQPGEYASDTTRETEGNET